MLYPPMYNLINEIRAIVGKVEEMLDEVKDKKKIERILDEVIAILNTLESFSNEGLPIVERILHRFESIVSFVNRIKIVLVILVALLVIGLWALVFKGC